MARKIAGTAAFALASAGLWWWHGPLTTLYAWAVAFLLYLIFVFLADESARLWDDAAQDAADRAAREHERIAVEEFDCSPVVALDRDEEAERFLAASEANG